MQRAEVLRLDAPGIRLNHAEDTTFSVRDAAEHILARAVGGAPWTVGTYAAAEHRTHEEHHHATECVHRSERILGDDPLTRVE